MRDLSDDLSAVSGPAPAPPTFTLSHSQISRPEGSAASVTFIYTVVRSGDLSEASTLTYSVAGSGDKPASASDFWGGQFPSGAITFAPGQSVQTIYVSALPDRVVETDEQFTLTVKVGADTLTATGVILDDDGTASPYNIRTVQKTGDDANRIGVVTMGDGYTAGEIGTTYKTDIDSMLKYMFEGGQLAEPFNRYSKFFNVYAIEVTSAESGVDDKSTGTYKNTALDSRFYFDGSTERLMSAEYGVSYATLDWALKNTTIKADMRLIVANSSKYGGAGGSFAAFSGSNAASRDVALHEIGHSFAGLADEYGGVGGYSGGEPFEVNLTKDPTGGKWAKWLGYDQPGVGVIGAYEGGGYANTGVYRPSQNSKMRILDTPFDAIAREQFILKFYALVDPLDSHTSNAATLIDPTGLDAKVIDPDVIMLRWSVDGVATDATSAHVDIGALNVASGTHRISVLAYDPTDWVRGDRSLLEQKVEWTVNLSRAVLTASDKTPNLKGGTLVDIMVGSVGANIFDGGAGDDTLEGKGGDDVLDGGAGADTAVYAGLSTNFSWTRGGDGAWTVLDLRTGRPEGSDTLRNIEILKFSDRSVSLSVAFSAAVETAFASILRGPTTATWASTVAADLLTKAGAGMSDAQLIAEIVKAADATTSVASLAYLFFTGKIPGQSGFDYLVAPGGTNASTLNSAYYQSFNVENRYINFAVNLGKNGEGKDAFAAKYGSLSLFDATREAYKAIFGGAPVDAKVHALIDSRVDYFASYGGDGPTGIGTKAAMVGWLLAEAEKSDLGVMARSNAAWLTDLADGSAPYAINVLDPANGYYRAEYIFGG